MVQGYAHRILYFFGSQTTILEQEVPKMIKRSMAQTKNSKKEHGARIKYWRKRKNEKGAWSTEKKKKYPANI